jgi:hypothetical protein
VPAGVLAACDLDAAVPVGCTARRDAGEPADRRGTWRVDEDTMAMSAPNRTTGPGLTLRRVFVHSTVRAGAAQRARARKLTRAAGDLGRLRRGLGTPHYPDEAAVRTRLAVTGKARRVAAYLTATAGPPARTREFGQTALDAEAAADGWHALLTNRDPAEADAAGVLQRFKGQETSERRYGNYKGPRAVAPLFLKHNRRIQALITVICLALLVFCLIERQVRTQIAPATKTPGLYAGRPARPWRILLALAGMRLIPATGDQPAVISRPTPLQQHLLDLLEVGPLKPP